MSAQYPDPFTRWEELKQEIADTLADMEHIAEEHDNAQREKEIIEDAAAKHGISLEDVA